MAKKKTSDSMSSDELFALAEQRRREEEVAVREAKKAEIGALREQRRELVAKQRKQLAALDAKIAKLGGRTGGARRGGRGRTGGVTESVLAVIGEAGTITTKELAAALEARGVVAGNLSQTLAYLKRTNRVNSPARATYTLA